MMHTPAATPSRSHLEALDQVQAKLQAQYERLRTRDGPPRSKARASAIALSRSAREAMEDVLRRRHAMRRPLRRQPRDWRGEPNLSVAGRIFIALLVIHIVLVGAIVGAEFFTDLPPVVAIGGILVASCLVLRAMGAVCRGLRSQRSTNRRRDARNCDRDIWL